jgi:hypothetical protein
MKIPRRHRPRIREQTNSTRRNNPHTNDEHQTHSVRIVETEQTVDAELADRNGVHQAVVAVTRATEALIPSYATSASHCVRCRKWIDVEFRRHPTSALQDTRIGDDVADGTGGEDQ